jgi:hypothetical protein
MERVKNGHKRLYRTSYEVEVSEMEANGKIVIPPADAQYSTSELWFILRNLPDNPSLSDTLKTSSLARVLEQCKTKKCTFQQVNQELLSEMNARQYPHLSQMH